MTLRGVAGADVFVDDADRMRLVVFVRKYLRECGARCLAWAWMDNHLHLIIETGRRSLAELVHGFAFRYAQYFNWRYARPGHLFQNRYGAKPIESDEHLCNAIAYVFLNPLKAGRVRSLDELATYRWTGFAGVLGERTEHLVDVPGVLSLFSEDVGGARAALRELVSRCLARWDADPKWSWQSASGSGRTGERIDASLETVRTRELEEARAFWDAKRLRASARRREGWTIDVVIGAVCARQRITARELLSFSRRRVVSDARALIAHFASDELGASCAEIARRLDLGESSTMRAVRRGASIARERAFTLEPRGSLSVA